MARSPCSALALARGIMGGCSGDCQPARNVPSCQGSPAGLLGAEEEGVGCILRASIASGTPNLCGTVECGRSDVRRMPDRIGGRRWWAHAHSDKDLSTGGRQSDSGLAREGGKHHPPPPTEQDLV